MLKIAARPATCKRIRLRRIPGPSSVSGFFPFRLYFLFRFKSSFSCLAFLGEFPSFCQSHFNGVLNLCYGAIGKITTLAGLGWATPIMRNGFSFLQICFDFAIQIRLWRNPYHLFRWMGSNLLNGVLMGFPSFGEKYFFGLALLIWSRAPFGLLAK